MSERIIAIQTLDTVPEEVAVQALNAAYADYFIPIYLTPSAFRQLVTREDIQLSRSVAALRGERMVGLGLLATRGARAWIGGLGVIPAFRQMGVGRQMMHGLLDHARDAGCTRVQLEVITRNEPAYILYESLGFRKLRRLSVLSSEMPIAPGFSAPHLTIRPGEPAALLRELPRFLKAELPWQHEIESFWPVIDRVEGLAAYDDGGALAGLCLWSGDDGQAGLMSLAGRSAEIGAALLVWLRGRLPDARLTYLNVPDDDPMAGVLIRAGFKETLAQYEMALDLSELSQENADDE
jgi:ribosomal protein S18 acetylase RimI-like enzyme